MKPNWGSCNTYMRMYNARFHKKSRRDIAIHRNTKCEILIHLYDIEPVELIEPLYSTFKYRMNREGFMDKVDEAKYTRVMVFGPYPREVAETVQLNLEMAIAFYLNYAIFNKHTGKRRFSISQRLVMMEDDHVDRTRKNPPSKSN